MMVENQLISPRYGLSVIGCIQDAVSGCYILTKDLVFNWQDALSILYKVGVTDFSGLPDKDEIHRREIFSLLLPKDFSFVGYSKQNKKRVEPYVVIKNGKLTKGYMDSGNLGHGQGLMLRNLHKQYGKDFTIDLLGKMVS